MMAITDPSVYEQKATILFLSKGYFSKAKLKSPFPLFSFFGSSVTSIPFKRKIVVFFKTQ